MTINSCGESRIFDFRAQLFSKWPLKQHTIIHRLEYVLPRSRFSVFSIITFVSVIFAGLKGETEAVLKSKKVFVQRKRRIAFF